MPARVTSAGWLAGALLAGLVLRLWFGLGYWQHKPLTHDEQEYLVLALNLAAGHGFSRELPGAFEGESVERFSRAPLYPVMLAGLFRLTGQPTDRLPSSVPPAVQVAQAFVGVLTIWLVAALARRAIPPPADALAAWLAALYPPLVWSGAYALSEAIYAPLILGSALVAGHVMDRADVGSRASGDVRHMLLSGALAGTAALVRSAALVFVLVAVAWLLWRRRWALALLLALGAAIVVAPWTLRNLTVHGRPIVVAADGGITFWTGNHPLAIGEGDMAANPAIKADHVEFRRPLQHLTPEQREPYYYRAAFEYIRSHPVDVAVLLVKKVFHTVVPVGPSYTLHSARYYWATVIAYVPLGLLALVALPGLGRSPQPPRALGLLVASSLLLCLIFFPQERFRIPVIDPAICVGAAWTLSRALRNTSLGRVRT